MLAQIFRGVSLFARVKAVFTVFFGSSLYSQTVNLVSNLPFLLPAIIASASLKYRRTVTSARFRVNPATDRVEILCTVTNVTSFTVGAGLPVGAIGVATAAPGGSEHPNYLSAKTEGQIPPKGDGELVAAMFFSAVKYRGLHLKVWLDLGPDNGPIQEFRDELFLNF